MHVFLGYGGGVHRTVAAQNTVCACERVDVRLSGNFFSSFLSSLRGFVQIALRARVHRVSSGEININKPPSPDAFVPFFDLLVFSAVYFFYL